MIYSIGHSTRTPDAFLAVLAAHEIQQLADIRTFPRSRRYPHFSIETLPRLLEQRGIGYRHFPGLGGLRKPKRDSGNTAWREAGFRGYADYMQTTAFDREVEDLLGFSDLAQTCFMCAEALWWRCHRQLLSDALLVRGVPVRHIMGPEPPKPHELSDFARVDCGRVTYPGLV